MVSIETHHADMIHDAQLDYYGKKLATCSADAHVKVVKWEPPAQRQKGVMVKDVAELVGALKKKGLL